MLNFDPKSGIFLAKNKSSPLSIFRFSEENFALAYEPIPLSIRLDTWRKMTKEIKAKYV